MEDQNISIGIHKRHTSFLNSKGKDFKTYLKLYYCRYIVASLGNLWRIFDLFKNNSGKNGKKYTASLKNKGRACWH